jgi:hypothetical protein
MFGIVVERRTIYDAVAMRFISPTTPRPYPSDPDPAGSRWLVPTGIEVDDHVVTWQGFGAHSRSVALDASMLDDFLNTLNAPSRQSAVRQWARAWGPLTLCRHEGDRRPHRLPGLFAISAPSIRRRTAEPLAAWRLLGEQLVALLVLARPVEPLSGDELGLWWAHLFSLSTTPPSKLLLDREGLTERLWQLVATWRAGAHVEVTPTIGPRAGSWAAGVGGAGGALVYLATEAAIRERPLQLCDACGRLFVRWDLRGFRPGRGSYCGRIACRRVAVRRAQVRWRAKPDVADRRRVAERERAAAKRAAQRGGRDG